MEPRDVAPRSDVESRWFDVDTAAKYLCTTRHAIYHRINRLQLPFIRDGRRVRFDRHAIDRWMKKGERYGMVHVIGKFRKERDVPMQPDAQAALEEQLQEDGKL
jgi:excisionase family DNA binding protein